MPMTPPEILSLPGLTGIRGIVFQISKDPTYYGFGPVDSWEWMKIHWGSLDEAKEIVHVD